MAGCIRLRMHVPVSDYDLLAGFCDNDNEPSSSTEFRNFITSANYRQTTLSILLLYYSATIIWKHRRRYAAEIAQSVWRLATGCTVRGSNPRWGGEIFRTRPDRSWGPPSLLYNGYRVLPGDNAAGKWC